MVGRRKGCDMKGRALLAAAVALVLATTLMAGCGGNKKETVEDNSKTLGNVTYEAIQVNAGEEFQVTLDSNPTTGYEWSITTVPDPKVVSKVGSKFIAPTDADTLGAPGREVWTFKGVGAGKTDIVFESRQVSDKSGTPAWTHNVAATVVAKPPTPPPAPNTYKDPKVPINEAVGREFHINLSEQTASTGYKWLLSSTYDHKVCVFEGVKFLTPTSSMPGAPQTEVWRFETVGKGTTKLTFNYVQPWDKNAKPANTLTFTVNVN